MKTPIVTEKYTIHKIDGAISNIYLVESNSGLLLIDPGVSSDITTVRNYLTNTIGKDLSDVRLTFVTHMHPDHSGGAAVIRKYFKVPVASHHRTGKWYSGLGGRLQHYFDRLMTIGVAHRQKQKIGSVWFERILAPDFPLFGREKLPFFPDWETVHVPGHTTHDMVLYNKKERILFAGDMVICVREGNFDLPMPIIFKNRIRKSYENLSEMEIKIICPAHGAPFSTDNQSEFFGYLKELTFKPLSTLSKKVHMLSFYSPEVRKKVVKNILIKLKNLRKHSVH